VRFEPALPEFLTSEAKFWNGDVFENMDYSIVHMIFNPGAVFALPIKKNQLTVMTQRNPHIAANFKPQYVEIAKRYPVGNKIVEEKLEFQVVDMDDNNCHVWVRDVVLNEFYSW